MMHRTPTLRCVVLISGCILISGCSTTAVKTADKPTTTSTTVTTRSPFAGYVSKTYEDAAHWICRGDSPDDPCDSDLDATVVEADGTTTVERYVPAKQPEIDCFYAYPTISRDQTPNSDLVPGENEEIFVARQQAARLGTQCRVFAPVYRSVTLTALVGGLSAGSQPGAARVGDWSLAYDDVLDAFKTYMANDNDGRGFVLIGHSQGAGLLSRLVAEVIDPSPVLRSQLVSAMLLGTAVAVPPGSDIGGDFKNVGACRAADQTGCVVSYASFRADSPPPSNSLFGRPRTGDGMALCTNPAALGGGDATLTPYLPTAGQSLLSGSSTAPPPDWLQGATISTPFVKLPGLVTGECVERDGFSYLALTVTGDPATPRVDTIGGDLSPEWGMHLIDANVAMGDLVDLVASQGAAFR